MIEPPVDLPIPANAIVVAVTGPGGLPVPGMCVTARAVFYGDFASAVTNVAGVVVLPTAGVRSSIGVRAVDCSDRRPGYVGTGASIPFNGGEPTGIVTTLLSVAQAGGFVGRALDDQGHPLAGVTIDGGSSSPRVTTDASGRFEAFKLASTVYFNALTSAGTLFCAPVVNIPAGSIVRGDLRCTNDPFAICVLQPQYCLGPE